MGSEIVYCDKCSEYLGDIVNGVLYKFGRIVTQPHICGRHILTEAEHERAQEEFRELGSNY